MTMLCCHKLKHHGPILQAQAQVRCNRFAIGVLLVARHCSTGIGGVGWQLGRRPALLRLVFQRVLQPQSNALTMSGDNGQGQCNYLWSMELIDQLDVLNSTSINPYLDCHWDAGSVQPSRAGTGMATHGQYLSRLRTAKQDWYWDGDPRSVLVEAPYGQAGLVLGWRPTASTCRGSVQPRAGTGMATHGQYLSRLRTAKQGWYWDGDPRPVLVEAPYGQAGLVLGWRPTASTCQGSVQPRAGTGMATHGQYLSRLRTAKGWYWDGDPRPVLVEAPYSQAGLVLGWRPTASTCRGSVQPSRAGTGMATHGQYLSRLRTAKQGWYWDGDPRSVLVEAPYSQAGLVLGWRPTASTCRGSVQPSRTGTGMATHGQYLSRLRTAKQGWYWDGDPRSVLVEAPYSQAGLVLGWRPTVSTCRGSVQPSRPGTGMATHGQYLSRLRTAKQDWYWDGDPRSVLVEAPYSQAGLVLGWRPTVSTCRGSVQPSRTGTGMATHGQYLSRLRTAKQDWYWDGDPRPVLVEAPYSQAGLVLGWRPTVSTC